MIGKGPGHVKPDLIPSVPSKKVVMRSFFLLIFLLITMEGAMLQNTLVFHGYPCGQRRAGMTLIAI